MRRFLSLLSLLALLSALAGGVAAQTPASGPPTALVYVPLTSHEDLARFEETGLPAYARMTGREEEYLLIGATPEEMSTLSRAGLFFRILDPDTTGATYYLAFPTPGRPIPRWGNYGRLLLNDGFQVLLRTPPAQAERLVREGVEIQALFLDPKPLRPWAAEDVIPAVINPDPLIQTMIDQVTTATVRTYNRQLAGELPVWVDGEWYTIPTRYTYSGTPIQKTTRWAGQCFAGLGLDVEYHQWGGSTYPNVIGEYTGLINPDDIFIICAHVDDVQGTPGADDNGSGSTAVLIAADILTQYRWGCTLRFALWTGEEQGLLGSYAYAQRSRNINENILDVVNLDMIAWNTPGSNPDIDLYARTSIPRSVALAQLFADVIDAYDLDLVPQILTSGGSGSDNSSFWQFNYSAILGIEDNNDFNPYYHDPGDTPAHTDLLYFTEFVKAALATFAHASGCLIPSGLGAVDGYVTDSTSGAPIPGATVRARDSSGHVFSATTDPTGYYTRTLLADTYVVTATAYGYLPASVSGVVVVTDNVTTQDFALQPAPTYVVSGTVTEAGTGLPLFAHITFDGSPDETWSDPATGFYTIALPQGTYTMHVIAYGHRPAQRAIVVDHNQTQDFALEPLPCILLVDDDNNNPDTRPYFTAALDTLGYDYDVFDVGSGSGNGPSLAQMQGYAIVIWFSGDKYGGGGSAGPNATDEANLSAYLDGGGRLFLSSQDYLYDFGLTPFGQNYLGIGSYTNDDGNASTKYGRAGDPIGDGLGPYPLTYPPGFSDYGDIVNAGAGASVAFRSAPAGGNNLDVDKDGGAWRTVFFGTDWVPIYYNNAANGREVLQRIIDWFGGCQPPVLTPTLVVSPEAFTVTLVTGFRYTATLTVGNAGNGILYFTLTEAPEVTWLAEKPAGGSVNPGSSLPVAVSFDAAGLAPGPYLTTLQVHSNDPLSPLVPVTVTLTVIPEQPPQASFTSNTPVCLGEEAVFTDTSNPGFPPADAFLWDFGDGITSTVEHPTHTYAAAGIYSVTFRLCNAVGCDEAGDAFIVEAAPQAGFTYSVSLLTAVFTNTSRNATAFLWDFGDGVTSTVEHPTHTYAAAGLYTVTLTAQGCGSDVYQAALTLTLTPTASFTSNTPVCLGEEAVFTDTSNPGFPPADAFLWDFGDGSTSTVEHPTHTYAAAGIYSVTFRLCNAVGCDEAGDAFIVEAAPQAGFTYSVSLLTAVFTNTSQNATAYLWDFGDGVTSTVEHPTHTYAAAGIYTVTLTAQGCGSDVYQAALTLTLTPTASFTSNTPVCLGEPMVFTNTTTGTPPIFYEWSFGDGETSTETNPIHIYTAATTYTVVLTAANAVGIDTCSAEVEVLPLPEAAFTYTVIGLMATFTNTSRNAASYLWDFGDGVTSTVEHPTHTYAAAGIYTVTLTAQGCGSDVYRAALTLTLTPTASFTSNTPVCLGEEAVFTDTSNPGFPPADAFLWDFGDGSTSTVEHPTHTYAAAGTYSVTFRLCNAVGCDEAGDVFIVEAAPQAGFTYSVSLLTAVFTNTSRNAAAYLWNFGDGVTSTVEHPTHTYAAAGTYTVTLMAAGRCGEDMMAMPLRVEAEQPLWRIYLPLVLGGWSAR